VGGGGELVGEVGKLLQPWAEMRVESEREVEKFSCSLVGRKEVRGVLRILEKNLVFNSSSNEVEINVPIDYVCEVQARIKTFEKELSVNTSMGELVFAHFPEISKAEVLVQQQVNANASKVAPKKASVQLTPEELQFIAARRPKIEGELESLEGYEEKASVVLEEATVDAVYDLAYSDKPFKLRGKEECCFFAYVLSKSNGSNYSTSRYEPAGPRFYSLEEGRSFVNSPLVSTRGAQYEVPLPPIPFMPKMCSNSETIRMYWISHEQFDYSIRCTSKGPPYADTFFISILHRVAKQATAV
jgi:hypothetical protein